VCSHQVFPEDTPLSACSFVCLSRTENGYTHNILNAYNSPWSGPVDGVIGERHLAALSCSFRCSGLLQRGERGRGSVCSFSILYRISLFPFPFAVVCVFTFSKNLCRIVFFPCVASPHMPSSFSFSSFFTSPRLSIRSLLPSKRPRPLVAPYPYRIVPYYITIRILLSV
jgi:hypothetical protein